MNMHDMKFKAEGIVRQVFRDKGISERFGVTECVSGIIDSFREDKTSSASDVQDSKTVRRINSFLAHCGMRVVRIEDTNIDEALDMDEQAILDVVNSLAENLKAESDDSMKAADSFRTEIRSLREEIERARTESEQLRLELNGQRKATAGCVQSMLGVLGKEGGVFSDDLMSMLDELGMSAVWYEGEGIPEAAMFMVLKSPNRELSLSFN